MVTGLKGLKARLLEVEQYLQLVLAGKLPVNHDIMYQLQARVDNFKPLRINMCWQAILHVARGTLGLVNFACSNRCVPPQL